MEKRQKTVIALTLISLLSFNVVPLTYAQTTTKTQATTPSQTCNPDSLVPVSYGQKGEAVKNLQACLIKAGYNIPDGVTGYYGPQTRAAVKEFYSDWYGSWHGKSIKQEGIDELKSILMALTEPEESITLPTSPLPTSTIFSLTTSSSEIPEEFLQDIISSFNLPPEKVSELSEFLQGGIKEGLDLFYQGKPKEALLFAITLGFVLGIGLSGQEKLSATSTPLQVPGTSQ